MLFRSNHRITSLENFLDAPVPVNRFYTKTEEYALDMTPAQMEELFQRKYGKNSDIPSDYIDQLEDTLRKIMIRSTKAVKAQKWCYDVEVCPTTWVEMRFTKESLQCKVIYMRPCAEGLGIYKFLLWVLRHCVMIDDYPCLMFMN